MVARGETPQEGQSAYEEAWARHPLRDHPRFRLATAEEREDATTLVVFVGGSIWTPGGKRKAERVAALAKTNVDSVFAPFDSPSGRATRAPGTTGSPR